MPFKFNSVLSDSPDYFPFLFKVHLTRKSVPHFTYKLLCLSLTTRWTAGLADSMSTQRQNHYQFFLSIISFKWALMCSDWLKPATPVWKMMRRNHTVISEFVFQGFSSFQEYKFTLFMVFLTLYLLTLTGNAIIMIIIGIDRHLHTPMYFFLSMLSTSETVYTLVIVPRMLASLVGSSQSISLAGCATQMFFFITLAINNCFLLTAMGYDRYVAICNPLRSSVIMNKRVCAQLVWGSCNIVFKLHLYSGHLSVTEK